MRDETNYPGLESSNTDGQKTAGGRQRSGSPEKPFHTQDAGKRRGNGSSNGIKKLFTSPFPYFFMAILLTCILLFYGKQDAVQTASVRDENQPAQTQDGNLQDESMIEPQEDIPQEDIPQEDISQGENPLNETPQSETPLNEIPRIENHQPENPQSGVPQPDIPQPENPQSGVPQTDNPQSGVPQPDIPQPENSQPGIPEGGAQAETPGENLQGGYQAQNPQQAVPADKVNQGGVNSDSRGREDDISVPVQSITITAGTDVMAQGDTLQLTATVSPSNADNTALLWFSDDETIARVSQDGLVTSVSAGYTVISAVSSNGIQTDFPINVSSSRKVMTLTVSTECTQNDKVGSNWTYRYLMNGTPIHAVQNMMVEAGKTISLESEIIEHDEQPDLGSAENNYYVRQSDLEDGFEIRQEVFVQENRPKLAGNTASFVVTYRFSDAVE